MSQEHPQNYSDKDFSLLSRYLDEIVNRIEPYEKEQLDLEKIETVKKHIQLEGKKMGGHLEQDVELFIEHVDAFLGNKTKKTFDSFLSKAVKLKNDLWAL